MEHKQPKPGFPALQPLHFIQAELIDAEDEHDANHSNDTAISITLSLDESIDAPTTVRLTESTAQGFTEPLDGLGQAIPLEVLLIRSGTFTMGSPSDEFRHNEAEGPQHRVNVPTFFMGRYPITQAQWRVVAGMPPVNMALDAKSTCLFKGKKFHTAAFFKGGDDHPVAPISWNEAVEFCDRLTRHSGRPYRLPSEAEWEYACRAGTKTSFAFGKTLTTGIANYKGDRDRGDPRGLYREETTPVNHFGVANWWGLCDMHGNVREWCADHWHETYKGAPTDSSPWFLSDEEIKRLPCDAVFKRVIRGGACDDMASFCRSAYRRGWYTTNIFDVKFGFRVVCSVL
ncbi:MAG: formylglycine-generating enzyme family protein [Cyanobacteria bacterium J06635_15]